MALIPGTRYPAQTDAAAGYPHGKARNAGSYQDGTGTPLEQDWVNDLFGLQQSLLVRAGITPSGDPDEVGASQYLEAIERVARLKNIKHDVLFPHWFTSGTKNENSMAAIGAVPGLGTLVLKAGSNGAIIASNMTIAPTVIGTVPSITDEVVAAAYSTALERVVVVGTGGNRVAYSDDYGDNWTAGANPGSAPKCIVYVEPHDRFLINWGSVDVRHSTDATSWTSTTSGDSDTDGSGGLAVFENGDVVGLKDGDLTGSTPAFRTTTNANDSWSDTGGTVADAPDYDNTGRVAGSARTYIFHAGRLLAGTKLRVSRSADGSTWSTVAEFDPPAGAFAFVPTILVCQESGLVVVSCTYNTNYTAFYGSVDQGATWLDPVIVRYTANPGPGWALANGKFFLTQGDDVFMSAGIL
jgi:hypothetical protein